VTDTVGPTRAYRRERGCSQDLISPVDAPLESSRGRHRPWGIWLLWVLATGLGYLAAEILSVALMKRSSGGPALALVIGAGGLAAIGFLQWLVLRLRLRRLRWWSWVLATILGQVAGTFVIGLAVVLPILLGTMLTVARHVGEAALQVATQLVTGGILGAVIGFAQFLVLRRHPLAAWWVLAAAIAGAITAVVPPIPALGSAFDQAVAAIITRFVTGLITGSITGVALVWLIEKPQLVD
jgi:hypothetical protein